MLRQISLVQNAIGQEFPETNIDRDLARMKVFLTHPTKMFD